MKRCIINVAIGKPYTEYQLRLVKSIQEQMPGQDYFMWNDILPPGAKPHNDSMYGFKMYAFGNIFKTYDSVIWLDSPTVLHKSIAPLFDILEMDGELVVSTDVPLYKYVNDKTLNYYNFTREEVKNKEWMLNYGFVFGFTKGNKTYEKMVYAENIGLFSSFIDDNKDHVTNSGVLFNGEYVEHRHEESIISLIVQSEGRKLTPIWDLQGQDDKYFSWEKTPL